MLLQNLKDKSQQVSFEQAVKLGLGREQGLFFPARISPMDDIDALLNRPFHERSAVVLSHLLEQEIPQCDLLKIVEQSFPFPAPLTEVEANTHCLELFHGPSLAFKDFGARFMANCLKRFSDNKTITILTATSGDTGAAVAQAFYGMPNIQVKILFPKGKVSPLQQKMFSTLDGNIQTYAVDGSFDDCQALVKQSFDDHQLVSDIGLNSANSINISRLFAQVCYYFEAAAQLPRAQRQQSVFAIPSGNFGNLCAGIIARVLGLPVKRFIAATNTNDTVPRYLQTGVWSPKETIATLSNAMDVSRPNNWPRIQYLIDSRQFTAEGLSGAAISEQATADALRELAKKDYVSEPHAAVAYASLTRSLQPGETGIFLGTAHPAKFKSSVDKILGIDLPLPEAIAQAAAKADRAVSIRNDYQQLKACLYAKSL